MINYNSLDDLTKQNFKKEINDCALAIGGKHHFLHLLEEIRKENPHPLISKKLSFRFSYGTVKWGKVIFKDKVDLLIEITKDRQNNTNLMPEKGSRDYKTNMNFLRTLGPMIFEIRPKNNKDGDGFDLHPFDIIDEDTSHLSFMFDVVFFLPISIVKQIFIGTIK
ncbi:MAG: hypothetical protein HOA15_01580 [Candidatus Marinimicrobia bacterium]|jgi:hypothetical protein|nr:hypothetical protein [Candidatus Neomarinimicrobiota bacterium]MBT3675230.1 hypothetical protein [Candidatus Neomarinimicrobiota bacterium]MBT3764131.1 hypothetical protein [Candidatus Neomarinimicrobiota bacterium]MBT4069598.1 hypothetical protein [Candidatus Neomarinimicrobiota bacterium]MBT4270615.1 hypothetical protein [Candidatus Neomarinimicrobiota bacterium]